MYGPYLRTYKRSQPRYQVIIHFEDGSTTSTAHARWVMTQHLHRILLPGEHVDHKDENALNDNIDNLQILSLAENNRKTNIGKRSPFKGVEKGWAHGTVYAWMKKKCCCLVCMKAYREWHDRRNGRRRKSPSAP